MMPVFSPEEQQVLNVIKYQPAVSIILPFEPKMALKTELEYALKLACQQVEKELRASYPDDQAIPVLEKLHSLIKKLDYSTYKKSIALYVSPVLEKVLYLDIPVEKKIVVDQSFEIRDLVYCKKELHKYLVLVLSSERSRIYLGNTSTFMQLAANRPQHLAAFRNDPPERVANFSDPADRKEIMLDKFLRYVDAGLDLILKAYSLPLFVMGTDRTLGHFKKITHHLNHVSGYIHGNYDEASEAVIREVMAPHVADWKKVIQDDLLLKLDAAMSAHKLALGIKNVWKEASGGKGRLLVVEKNYMVAARHGQAEEILLENELPVVDNSLLIKDAVDDVIEKVLGAGGDVEFVEEGMLNGYEHIALIEYY
jgi:hypothetical protein